MGVVIGRCPLTTCYKGLSGTRPGHNGQAHVAGTFLLAREQARSSFHLLGADSLPSRGGSMLALAFTTRTAKESALVNPWTANFYLLKA